MPGTPVGSYDIGGTEHFIDAATVNGHTVNSDIPVSAVIVSGNNAGSHNSQYRGKALGSSVTADQWSVISDGSFEDLFIGDFWEINSIKWRIAAFDYWLHCGDTECTTHHIVIMPDSNLNVADGSTTHWMHSSDSTAGGYVGTNWYSGGNTGKASCLSAAEGAFGSAHILSHRELLTNASSSGAPSGWSWYDSKIEIPNEAMIYGRGAWGSHAGNGYNVGIDKTQLPLFALAPEHITNRSYWWLRDVVSGAYFAYVSEDGLASNGGASYPWVGVRPAFGIKA